MLLWALAAGTVVYCFLVLIATYRYLSVPPCAPAQLPISILKPLKGADLGLEENLRSFFTQSYSAPFEILFAVREDTDPAVPIVRRLMAEFPAVPSRLLLVGEPPVELNWHNAKVWSLHHLVQAAAHEVVLMSDSDIRVDDQLLAGIAGEFAANPKLGVATCPYRAVAGPSVWSQLEALGMNTEFIAGILVARLLEGMKFTLGPTVAARKQAIADIGGWPSLQTYLAEDFMLGQRVTEKGWDSILSRSLVEHHIGSETREANFAHRLRWNRSTRRSRPGGYVGQFFTNPLPILLACWPLTGFAPLYIPNLLFFRFSIAFATSNGILQDPFRYRYLWQLPLQDLLSFAFWIAGFFGKTIHWRGRTYELHPDGQFSLKK
jgi:ceramide glucosyltransferase